MAKKKTSTQALRSARYRESMHQKGFKQRMYWLNDTEHQQVTKYVESLRTGKSVNFDEILGI